MSALADHILRNQIAAARDLAEQDSASLLIASTGPEQLFPADIALRCGQLAMLVCLLRLGAPMKLSPPSSEALLHAYLGHLSTSYFSASMMDGIAVSVWEQLFEGRQVFYDDQDPPFGMSRSEQRDVHWLIQECRVGAKQALVGFETA